MKKTINIFDGNLNTLRIRNPELAEKLLTVQVPSYFDVVYSKSGHPVLKALNLTFHSLYDPVKEGRSFVESHLERMPLKPIQMITLFGLGFAYHIFALLEKNITAQIIEPRIEVLRLAMEHVDLKEIIEKMPILTGSDDDFPLCSSTELWAHQPSVKYNRATFERLKRATSNDSSSNVERNHVTEKDHLKIIVVTPIYGGSLPIATYCYRALENLGHEVELWDTSIFAKPFQKALALNLDDGNKKVLRDLFLHLISEMVVASCQDFRPDLVLALAQAPLSLKALERLRSSQITTAFWFVEDYQFMEYWQIYAPHYDFYFTIQEDGFMKELEKIGVQNYYYLPLAADPIIHRPIDLPKQERDEFGSDISFMGAGYYNREKMFGGLLDFNFKIWGNEWKPQSYLWKHVQRCGERITTDETVKVFNATKINLNLHSSVCHDGLNPFGDFVNPRTFEIGACEGFQLVDCRRLLGKHFNIGKELICYASLEELREQINYYLQHPQERIQIAKQTRERILKEHTYEHRMQDLLRFIRQRKPECFYLKSTKLPVIRDVKSFCHQHPEVKSLINDLNGDGQLINIDQIVSAIMSKNGSLEYHEALFCLIKEFQAKFQGVEY